MSFASKPTVSLHRKRLTYGLFAAALCTLCTLSACGNDDDAPARGQTNANAMTAGNDGANGNASTSNDNANGPGAAQLSANPASVAPAPAALAIQSPALPASSADPALSAAASTPLATPVIHTVD
nr:hypothetical protein HUO10_001049 [Paraburkholderia busanensis]